MLKLLSLLFFFSMFPFTLNLTATSIYTIEKALLIKENRNLQSRYTILKESGSQCYSSKECITCCSVDNICVVSKETEVCKEQFDKAGFIAALIISLIAIAAYFVFGCIIGKKFRNYN